LESEDFDTEFASDVILPAARGLLQDSLGDYVRQTQHPKFSNEWLRVVLRKVPGWPDITADVVVLVIAEWTSAFDMYLWQEAAKTIKTKVDKAIIDSGYAPYFPYDVGVEIIASELITDKYWTPVSNRDSKFLALQSEWNEHMSLLPPILNKNPSTSLWNTLACFKLGWDGNKLENNALTVSISLDQESDETEWEDVRVEIQSYLDQARFKHRMVAHMEHNAMSHFVFPLLDRQYDSNRKGKLNLGALRYEDRVGMGADICPAKFLTVIGGEMRMPPIGTAGAWVRIRTKQQPQGKVYLLSCYYIFRPGIDGFQCQRDAQGDVLKLVRVQGF